MLKSVHGLRVTGDSLEATTPLGWKTPELVQCLTPKSSRFVLHGSSAALCAHSHSQSTAGTSQGPSAMYATGNTTWSVPMGLDQSMYAEDCNAGCHGSSSFAPWMDLQPDRLKSELQRKEQLNLTFVLENIAAQRGCYGSLAFVLCKELEVLR